MQIGPCLHLECQSVSAVCESGVIEKPQDHKDPALALPKDPVSMEEKASDKAGPKSPPLGSVCTRTMHTALPK